MRESRQEFTQFVSRLVWSRPDNGEAHDSTHTRARQRDANGFERDTRENQVFNGSKREHPLRAFCKASATQNGRGHRQPTVKRPPRNSDLPNDSRVLRELTEPALSVKFYEGRNFVTKAMPALGWVFRV